MAKGITKQQKVFISEFMKDGNGARSARAAGYSKSYANNAIEKLKNVPAVKKALEIQHAEKLKKINITVDEIVSDLVTIKNWCITDRNYIGAMRALELLGKHLAMFTEKHKVDLTSNINVNLALVNAIEKYAEK